MINRRSVVTYQINILLRYKMPLDMIKMSKADLLAEHKKLMKVLQHGTRKEQLAEARR